MFGFYYHFFSPFGALLLTDMYAACFFFYFGCEFVWNFLSLAIKIFFFFCDLGFDGSLFLVAGVVFQSKPLQDLSGQICRICEDELGITVNGEPFIACNECAFPVCRPCYEYERREGDQACPNCNTRYKRHKGSVLGPSLLLCISVVI